MKPTVRIVLEFEPEIVDEITLKLELDSVQKYLIEQWRRPSYGYIEITEPVTRRIG